MIQLGFHPKTLSPKYIGEINHFHATPPICRMKLTLSLINPIHLLLGLLLAISPSRAADYHLDASKIGVMGGSAGGHLALFLGVTAGVLSFEGDGNLNQSSAVSCVVSFFGPSDFTQSYGKSVDAHEVLPLFFGGNLEQKRREHIWGSPLNWVTPQVPPTLCIHGTEDKYVAFEQAVWMVDRLKACGVEAELLKLDGAGHGFKAADQEKADSAMLAFFDQHLKVPSK